MSCSLLFVDSGAFSVWSGGGKVDLDAYIKFCEDYPACDVFVSLDVIPGEPNNIRSLSKTSIEAACEEGWKNYQRMIKVLPKEKVMPVFHQGDGINWLKRFIDSGAEYIGISPANDRTTTQRIKWLTHNTLFAPSIQKVVTNQKGNPIVKTHGFAVTGNRIMSCSFPWASVDSVSWAISSAMGMILVPVWRDGKWDYSVDPWTINVSDRSPKKEWDYHIDHLSADKRECIVRYLQEEKIGPGHWKTKEVPVGTKLVRGKERWLDKEKRIAIVVTKKGVRTDDQARKWVNIRYFQRTAEALGLKIFIAGCGAKHKLEEIVKYRLISYAVMEKDVFEYHYNGRENENRS